VTETAGSIRPSGVRRAPGGAGDQLPSRRSLRDQRNGPDRREQEPLRPRQAPPVRTTAPGTSSTPVAAKRRTASRVVFSAVVMTFAAALVATIALPSYAFDPVHAAGSAGGRTTTKQGHQRFEASGDVQNATIKRDTISATTSQELQQRVAEQKRKEFAATYASYSGPSATDYIKNPAHPAFSLSAVYQRALQYRGVPYVFGGADPSGFDCSGFIMFVYAQFGVSLAHSVHQQDAVGTQISQADAQPGDVVVFNDDSHDGFYAGNGMILHAPYEGASVRLQPLWSSDVHFVRFGIG
jgi:peptidoglycan DL-endopeptidase CwlO